MRLTCPFCGERDAQEFSYLGDATLRRPDPAAPDAPGAFHDYVYLRDNPAGLHREYWHHVAGCRSWLVVTRDTRSHEVAAVELAGGKTA
jgi:heterotetrameric sarcosine oxidase delta subunit